MGWPTLVTMTGADDSMRPADLQPISKRFPNVEWGILFSQSHQGQPRYPSAAWLDELQKMDRTGMHFSAHLCGRWVRDLVLDGDFTWLDQLGMGDVFDRIQLNFHAQSHDQLLGLLTWIRDRRPPLGKPFILQCDGVNDEAILDASSGMHGALELAPLFDRSGGAGIVPKVWPSAWPGAPRCGYAGGLGPDNIAVQLRQIRIATQGVPYWIDMETQVRTADDSKFELDKVVRVLEAIDQMKEEALRAVDA